MLENKNYSKIGNIKMKIGFWKGKASMNPKLEKLALAEIEKLEIELRAEQAKNFK